jgi:HK97 family phage major capsid protein
MNLKEMIERLNAISKRLGELGEKYAKGETLTAEEDGELDKLLAEFNDLGPQVERYGALEKTRKASADAAAQYGQSTGRVSGIVPNGATEQLGDGRGAGGRQVDRRGPGQRFAESDQLKEFLSGGAKTSARVAIGSLNPRVAETTYGGDGPIDRYTLVSSGIQPSFMVPPQVLPGIFRGRDYALSARDVLINGRTNSDTIYFLRELLFTNNAAETAEATAATGSSGTKPESAITFEEASAPVVTIAHWVPVTRQMLADAAQIQTYIEGRLMVGYERRVNSQVWNGAGGGTNMTGILNTTGVQALDDGGAGTYFADNPVRNAGTGLENFDRILRATTEIDLTGDATATFIALNPADLEAFMTTSDANDNYIGNGPFNAAGPRTLWGYAVAVDRAIPEGTAVVGDGTMAAIWDREDANILIDTINDQFIRNMLTILCEGRVALTVFRPAGFAEVTLAAW